MYRHFLALIFFFFGSIYSLVAQEQEIIAKAKVVKFQKPYDKINLEFQEEEYKGFSEFSVDSSVALLSKKGKVISPEGINEGAEVEVKLKRKGYKTSLVSIKFISSEMKPAQPKEQGKQKRQYATETYTGKRTFAVGRGIGSNLGRDINFSSTSPSWGIYLDRIGKIRVLGQNLTENKFAFFTIGAYVGWKTYERRDWVSGFLNNNIPASFETNERWRYFVVGGRTTLHLLAFRPWKRWDPYAGFMLSFNFLSYSNNQSSSGLVGLRTASGKVPNYEYYNPAKSNGKLSFFAGSRYYLFRRLAAFAEIGYGISYLQFGLSLNGR